MSPDKLEWEFGRFKIWCGNLGALQSGKSSLDSRLRESTVMCTNVLRHLARLNQTLIKSTEVTSGARLPLEKLPKPEDSSSESSSEESESDDELLNELGLHLVTIKEILNDLYMLSFRIRNSSTRPTSALRIKLFSDIDSETGIDKFAAYTEFDKRHIEDSLLQFRRDAAKAMERKPSEVARITDADQFLIDRLVATVNMRRKVLRYWQLHAKKIGEMPDEVKVVTQSMIEKWGKRVQSVEPSVTERTMLSKTEATKYDKRLDGMLEVQSIISYASIAVDVHSNDVELPPPPSAASSGTEFLCPYCGIVCPARHGEHRAWRAHILQDLQPYICTYNECEDRDRLFNSRTAWLEHERLGHRRVWLCFEHTEPKFWSKVALQHHLESEHGNNITETQIQDLVEVSELSVEDTRTACPFCLLEGPFPKGFKNHMAFHMWKFAAFSVPRDISTHIEDDIDANDNQSGRAQGLSSRDSLVSGPIQFDSRPPSIAASDADKQAFQSPALSLSYEKSLGEDESDEPPAVPLECSPSPVSIVSIPVGMKTSSPESSHNSRDDEQSSIRGRSRYLEAEKLKDSCAALRSKELKRASLPDQEKAGVDSHLTNRLPMVRNKAGELVHPALRKSSARPSSGLPGTPAYAKAVHFDSHLEHLRDFLQVDNPIAVSAGSSPVENYESVNEFAFGFDESRTHLSSPPHEWEIHIANFLPDSEARGALPVFVERVFMSPDNETLIGVVAVQNLVDHQSVFARFTLDYWKTTSEVVAEYNGGNQQKREDEYIRFNFLIRLADQVNLENKTLFFCIRYVVNDQEFWDNNDSLNYQVDFVKKTKPQDDK